MVVFGAAGSVPKTSRAFVAAFFLGFFCRVCRDVKKESIYFALLRRGAFAALLLCFFVYVTFADVKRVPLLHDIFNRDTEKVEQPVGSGE